MIKQGLILLLVMISYPISAQEWISNEMTEYFSDKVILDLSVNQGIIWACSQGIIRADESGFTVYQFDTLSSGKLENFEVDFPGNMSFNQIKSNGKTTYIFNGYSTFIKIEDGRVNNFTFPFDYYNPGLEFEVDNKGRLWILDMDLVNSEFVNDVYYLDGKVIKRFELGNVGMEPETIIANQKIYILMHGNDNERKNEYQLWIINNKNEIEKQSLIGDVYQLESDDENVYLRTNEKIIVINKGEDLNTAKNFSFIRNSDNSAAPYASFTKIIGEWIYSSDIYGLRRYNYVTNVNEDISINYNTQESIFSDFNLYNDMRLVGKKTSTFGIFSRIPEVKPGIKILNINP